jgi:DNA-binding NarL/FixJ family response regulator
MEMTTEYESGYVYGFDVCAVYVSKEADDPEAVAQQANSINRSLPAEATRLESDPDDSRPALERAHLLAGLQDRSDVWEFDHLDVSEDKHPRVPATLVAEGKASVAAYLAVQGLDNTEIGGVLGVGNRTVSQYISDFKSGER